MSCLSESAATLEAESGYTMEIPDVSRFRQCILNGDWTSAEEVLGRLGFADDDGLWVRALPRPIPTKTFDMRHLGCQIPNQSAEISGAPGNGEDDGSVADTA